MRKTVSAKNAEASQWPRLPKQAPGNEQSKESRSFSAILFSVASRRAEAYLRAMLITTKKRRNELDSVSLVVSGWPARVVALLAAAAGVWKIWH